MDLQDEKHAKARPRKAASVPSSLPSASSSSSSSTRSTPMRSASTKSTASKSSSKKPIFKGVDSIVHFATGVWRKFYGDTNHKRKKSASSPDLNSNKGKSKESLRPRPRKRASHNERDGSHKKSVMRHRKSKEEEITIDNASPSSSSEGSIKESASASHSSLSDTIYTYAKSLLASESAYVSQLFLLRELFSIALSEDFINLFPHVENLAKFHPTMVGEMMEVVASHHGSRPKSILPVFVRLSPFLADYEIYISKLPEIQLTLEKSLSKNKALDQFVEKHNPEVKRELLPKDYERSWIKGLLRAPLRRIPRYGAVISELFKLMKLGSGEYRDLLLVYDNILNTIDLITRVEKNWVSEVDNKEEHFACRRGYRGGVRMGQTGHFRKNIRSKVK